MHIIVQLVLVAFALWCAHLAGIHYAHSRGNVAQKRAGMARTAVAVIAALAVIFVR